METKINDLNNEIRVSKSCNEEKIHNYVYYDKIDKNNIFSFIIEKIQNLILFVDDDKNFENKDINLNNKIVEIKEGFILYDLLEQNILLLKNKIVNKYHKLFNKNNNIIKLKEMQENKYKKKSYDLDQMKKTYEQKNSQNKQIINQLYHTINKKDEEINKLNNKISELPQDHSILISQSNFNDFYQNLISRINTNYIKECNLQIYNNFEDNNINKMKNIIELFDFMNKKINHLNYFVKEYENYKIKVSKIINQNLDRSNSQNDEIKELKYMIKDLNYLLEQSNIYLNHSRKENDQLKKRNLNLEKTINVMSKNNIMTISTSNKEN